MADELNINIGLNSAKAKDNLDKLNKSADKFNKDTQKGLKKTESSFLSMGSVIGGGLLLGAFFKLKNAVTGSFGAFKDFEKALLEIKTILPKNTKLTDKQVTALIRLSAAYGTSQTAQAKAFYQTVSAGITDTGTAFEVLEAANQAALGGLGELDSSINLLTDVLNVYGKENITAGDAADILFQTVKLGKTRVEELSTSMGSVLPMAKQLGISFVEVSGALALLTTKGQSTAERVTQLNSLFTAVVKNQDRAAKMGGAVASAFNLTALKAKGLSKFLEDLTIATGGSEVVLQELIGRTEGVKAVLGLTQGGLEAFNNTLDQYKNRAGAAAAASNKIKEALDFKLSEATAEFAALTTQMYQLIKPVLLKGLGVLNNTMKFLFGSKQKKRISEIAKSISFAKVRIASLNEYVESQKTGGVGAWFKSIVISSDDAQKKLAMHHKNLKKLMAEHERLTGTKGRGDKLPLTPLQLQALSETQTLKEESEAAAILLQEQLAKQMAIRQAHQEKLKALEVDSLLQKQEARDIEAAEELIRNEEKFQKLAETLGQEEAIKAIAENIALKRQNKFTEARKKLGLVELKAHKQQLKAAEVADKAALAMKTQNQAKEESAISSSLQRISILMSSHNKAMFYIGKAAALASTTISAIKAHMTALEAGPILGPILAAAVDVASAMQIAKLVAQKPPAYATGGVIGGFQGATGGSDDINITAREGEMILNASQQKQLFDKISSGGENAPIIVEIDGREIARAVRDQLTAGYQLA